MLIYILLTIVIIPKVAYYFLGKTPTIKHLKVKKYHDDLESTLDWDTWNAQHGDEYRDEDSLI